MKFILIVFLIYISIPTSKGMIDFKGTLRKYFLLEAALMNTTTNMVCSPFAALIAIAKISLGVPIGYPHELYQAMGVQRDQFVLHFKPIVAYLEDMSFGKLSLASKTFITDDGVIKKEFRWECMELFNSSIGKVDFDDPAEAADVINKWVKNRTNKQIEDIVLQSDFVPHETSMVVVSGVFYTGMWVTDFCTLTLQNFYSPHGVREKTQMMSNLSTYKYYRSNSLLAQLVEIPFADRRMSLLVLLPFEKRGVARLLERIKAYPDIFEDELIEMKNTAVLLRIPMFEMESALDLGELYKKIGLVKVFDKDSGITNAVQNEELYISKAVQKVKIVIKDKGAKPCKRVIPQLHFMNTTIFNADHPFIFYGLYMKQQLFAGIYT